MAGIDDGYKAAVRELSDRLVAAQRPIRLLGAIGWDAGVKERFFASGFSEQPAIDADTYADRPLRFDPRDLVDTFRSIEADAATRLGPLSPAGKLIRTSAEQYRLVVDLLESRGTARFAVLSQLLYGSPADVLYAGGPSVADLARILRAQLGVMGRSFIDLEEDRSIPGHEAARILQERFDAVMGVGAVDVRVDDKIAADAVAAATYVKVRADRWFSERDLRLLEAHEGWVHIGTSRAGAAQRYCTFLGKAAPRTTVTQEGLAVLVEVLTFRSSPSRLSKLLRRVEGIGMAADGASFREVFAAYVDDGTDPEEAYASAARIFRGSTPDGGPFTKDLGYVKGFLLSTAYVRAALRLGQFHRIPMLFCGKVDLMDMSTLHHLEDEGLVDPPTFVSPPFDDLPALASTLAMLRTSLEIDMDRMEADLVALF